MKTDLHMHSYFSDGKESPEELVALAYSYGLQQIALTDHDTFGGVPYFMNACQSKGLTGIVGVEIDFEPEQDLHGYKSEILGYFPKGRYEHTEQMLLEQLICRRDLAEISLQIAKEQYGLGAQYNYSNFLGHRYGTIDSAIEDKISVTKPDIYSFLIELIEGRTFSSKYPNYGLFKKNFFKHSFFKSNKGFKKSAKQVISTINKDGGLAVLAHPAAFIKFQMGNVDISFYEKLLNLYKSYGLWGIELHSCNGSKEASKINTYFNNVAASIGLEITYGSDHHGCLTDRNTLGGYWGEMKSLKV